MQAIKFMKLDLTLLRSWGKFFVIIPVIMLIFSINMQVAFALNYLFFFLMLISVTPFSYETVENCQKLYYTLPGKISDMVMGRYLFLLLSVAALLAFDTVTISILISMDMIPMIDIITILMSIVVGVLLCLIQYPVYYKYGYQKGKLSSMLIYMIPAFIVFLLPSVISEQGAAASKALQVIEFLSRYPIIIAGIIIAIVVLAAWISYSLSVSICKKKEI